MAPTGSIMGSVGCIGQHRAAGGGWGGRRAGGGGGGGRGVPQKRRVTAGDGMSTARDQPPTIAAWDRQTAARLRAMGPFYRFNDLGTRRALISLLFFGCVCCGYSQWFAERPSDEWGIQEWGYCTHTPLSKCLPYIRRRGCPLIYDDD